MGYRKGTVETRGIIKVVLTETGSSGLAASIDSRVTGRRFGLTLHPFRRIDAKLIAAADEAIKAKKSPQEQEAAKEKVLNQQQADTIYDGATSEVPPTSANSDSSQTKTDQEKQAQADKNAAAQQAKSASDGVVSEGQTTDTAITNNDPGAIGKFAGSIQGKITLGGAALAGLACVARGLDAKASAIKEAQVNEPLMRMAVQLQSSSSQTRTGLDMNNEQLRNYAYRINGFSQGEVYKAETGQPYEKKNVSSTLKNINYSATPFHFLNESPATDILSPICSTVGQGILVAISFLGGPLTAISGLAAGAIFGPPIIDALAHWFSGHAVSIADHGKALSDDIGYGTKLFANADVIAKAGSKLTPKKAAELNTQNKIAYQNQLNSESFFERTFSPTNQSSVVATLIDRSSILSSKGIAGSLSSLFSLQTYSGYFSSTLYAKASADTFSESYDYGVPTYGFNSDEMENAATSDPFANANTASVILDGKGSQANADRAAKFISRASKCYGANLTSTPSAQDPSVNVWSVMVNSASNANHNTNYYSDEYNNISGECADSDPAWLSVRFMIFDTQTMKAVACDEGDDQSCTELGFGSSSASDTTSASPDGSIASGGGITFPLKTTKDVIEHNTGTSSVWCFDKQINCHHDYNAADIFAPTGTVVVAARAGKVVFAHSSADFGQTVDIKADSGQNNYYAHMGTGTVLVKAGDIVVAGQPIGQVGDNSDADGTNHHLHFDELPTSYSSRMSCSAAACTGYPFINVQPELVAAFNALP
jgi:murein DD-endopeptidase MepM/ murein hydrolase activator NlpD